MALAQNSNKLEMAVFCGLETDFQTKRARNRRERAFTTPGIFGKCRSPTGLFQT
jgi:hypothetical protein